jgi:hypothetical protein
MFIARSNAAFTVVLLVGTLLPLTVTADEARRFSGTENGSTPVFETGGPWLLYWSTRSEFPEMASIELRVYEAASGEFLGSVRDDDGAQGGRRLFESAGSYRVQVIAKALAWDIEIVEVDRQQAESLERASEGRSTLEDLAAKEARQVPADSFASWRPVNDSTLLLFSRDEATGFRVLFEAPCSGLSAAKALSFVGAASGGPERYDSIMLEDGTRCYFDRVVPTVFD